MVKKKSQMFIIIGIFTFILFLGGTTYAWFTYRRETSEQKLMAGTIYLHLNEGQEEIEMSNVFPETKEEARVRNDNYITFTIDGKNTSNKTIYYEIDLKHGTDKDSPKVRYRDQDLRFDLVELDSNDNEVRYLLSNVGYDSLVNKKIYVDTIEANTSVEVLRKYKLRMWLSDEVIISDTELNATYPATGYNNYYGNIKVSVIGDFTEKYFGYQKVKKAILAKQNAETNSCNPTWTDTEDGIVYFSGTNDCVDMNYVWYSGKLWRITAIYPDGAMKLVTQNNITSIAFNESEQLNFYTDANTTSYIYQWLNEDFYDTLYNASNFIDTTKRWNTTIPADTNISTKPLETNMITANIGLLNNYEFYNSYRCISSATCTGSSYYIGYLNIGYCWWLLNPYDTSYVLSVGYSGSGNGDNPTYRRGVRPSIVIKTGLEFTGEGTSISPYKIVGDKDTGASNELINTRISGEYLKLDNGTTNQLFRIIGVEDNKTKIIAMDYAENNNTRKFATSTGSANALWGSGTSTNTDTWYTYLNDNSTGYLKNLKDTYGELFDSGLYYLGTSERNYKLSVCATTTSEKTSVCTKTSNKGTFNIGLPRYGEIFATQQGGGYSNSFDMWLMNRYSASDIWVININGSGVNHIPTDTYGARPTVHLKSTVKIISGTGTENDPYVVGL